MRLRLLNILPRDNTMDKENTFFSYKNKLVIANWKMNGSKSLIDTYNEKFITYDDFCYCPPDIYLESARSLGHKVAGQNISVHENGAFTGQVSSVMLQEYAIQACLVGHSECRQYLGDSDEDVKMKAESLISRSILPIICIGEDIETYERQQTLSFLTDQCLKCLPKTGDYIVAYEPLWAIGTGKTPIPEEINSIHGHIKSFTDAKVLYGGSVNGNNAKDIFEQKNIDGVLVGGASLKVDEMEKILHARGSFS